MPSYIKDFSLKRHLAPEQPRPPLPSVKAIDTPAAAVRALAEQAGLVHALLERAVADALADPRKADTVILISGESRRCIANLLALVQQSRPETR